VPTIKFYIEDNKLKKEDAEATINQDSTDNTFLFELNDEWEGCKVWCLVKTPRPTTYRLEVIATSEGHICDVPKNVTNENFIKLSLYSDCGNDRLTTNELIIPIDRAGYLEHIPMHHHDRFKHHGKYHFHHRFPDVFHPTHTQDYRPCHHPSPNDPFHHHIHDKHCHEKHHKHHHDNHCPKPGHIKQKNIRLKYGNNKYVDIYDFILKELKETINHFHFDDNKCYAYHNQDLVQIIPLPDFVTRDEMHSFFGEVVSEVVFDEDTGELYTITNKFEED